MSTSIRQSFRLFLLATSLSCSMLLSEGCSTATVTARQAPLADDTYKTTVWAFGWGASDPVESIDCGSNTGLKVVSVSTSWVYSLITVVTLGAVVPMDIEYRCASEPMQGGGDIGAVREGGQ